VSEEPELDYEEMTKNTTVPPNLNFCLKGFQSVEQAKELANWTFDFLKIIGAKLNLERLDGITIAFDYAKALAELERGYETKLVLTPSSEFAQGVAMAPAVKRDGVIKTHIVFDANVFLRFMDTNDEYWPWIYYQLAHECGHVHDRHAFDQALPSLLLTLHDFGDELSKTRYELGDGCWSEYAASRLSAEYYPGQVAHFEEVLLATQEGLDDRTAAIMAKFAEDNDGVWCFKSLCQEYERIMKFASYLLGHINGMGGEVDAAPKFKEFLDSKNWLSEYIIELDNTLDELWDNYGKWTSYKDFNGLGCPTSCRNTRRERPDTRRANARHYSLKRRSK
jgi:hypothetical protein